MSQSSVEFNPMYTNITFNETDIYNVENMLAKEMISAYSEVIVRQQLMPKNFIRLSEASKAFREALTAQILLDASNTGNYDGVIDTFVTWLQMTPPGVSTLKTLQEYAAAITFAVERKDLTVKIIKRGQPGETTPAVWLIIDAMKKGMPGVLYQNLLLNSLPSAITVVDEQQRSGYLRSYLQ